MSRLEELKPDFWPPLIGHGCYLPLEDCWIYSPVAAEAIETWLACGMGQVIDTGGKPDYARKPAAGAYDGKALDVQPVAE